ncbi:MAG: hypothetical protein PVH61_20695 [Candidatus Aminicenantes bacterium]|jgi:hypothetical protein
MTKQTNITIENKFVLEERDMNVYHHSTRSAHMISPGSSITIPLKSVIEDDYLHISIVSGPGRLEGNCVVSLPSWVDFELSSAGDAATIRSGDRTLLKISPGLPKWQLRITHSLSSIINQSSDRVIIGDNHQEEL